MATSPSRRRTPPYRKRPGGGVSPDHGVPQPATVTTWLPWWPASWRGVAIGLLALLLYANTGFNEYAIDDIVVISQNEYTLQGVRGIPRILTTDSMEGFQRMGGAATYFSHYRALSLITFALEVELFGTNPHVSHLINALLFAATCLLLWFWLRMCLPRDAALLAGLLFALHPIHIEAVGNIKGRDELLSLFFLLLTAYSLFQYLQHRRLGWLALSFPAYFLALLSKENGATFLGILPLSVYVLQRRSIVDSLKWLLPYLGVFALYMLLRISVTGLDVSTEADSVLNNRFLNTSPTERFATISYILFRYLGMLFFPHPLAWDYSYNEIGIRSLGDPMALASLVVNLALLGWGVVHGLKRNLLAWGILFYYLSLSIVSNIFVNIGGFVGERFLYQPSVGFVVAMGVAFHRLFQLLGTTKRVQTLALPVLGAMCLLSAVKIIGRNTHWKNNNTLFTRDIHACPRSAMCNRSAGSAFMNMALEDSTAASYQPRLDSAEKYLRRALRIEAGYFDAAVEMIRLYNTRRQPDSAARWLTYARQILPDHPLIQTHREQVSGAYLYEGYQLSQQNRLDSAAQRLKQAVEINPMNHQAYFGLGIIHGRAGQIQASIPYFQQAAQLDSGNVDYWYNLGMSWQALGAADSARLAWQRVLEINPEHQPARQALAALPE